jgi:hypothetical protein
MDRSDWRGGAIAAGRLAEDQLGGQQHDRRPFDMLLPAVPIRHDRLEPSTITGGNPRLRSPCACRHRSPPRMPEGHP